MPPIWMGFKPKFSEQGSLFSVDFHEHQWVIKKLAVYRQNGPFSVKIHHKSGYESKFW